MDAQPEVWIRTRTDVTISANEVKRALCLHLSKVLVPSLAPPVRGSISSISVLVSMDDNGELLGATLSYEPDDVQAAPVERVGGE